MATADEPRQFEDIFAGATVLGLDSAELLDRFTATGDKAAFAAIVARHGPMVLATCRRLLANRADADDAFQATFLVFVRQARTIRNGDRLAPWLHGVARRVAIRAGLASARRQRVEGDEPGDHAVAAPPNDARELRAVLDEELARLPAKFRDPLVLCYLEGLTHDEAAGQLACPVGTVRSRLAGGRDQLRSRLTRRGFAPGALSVLFPAAPLPSAVVSRLLQAATVRLAFTSTSGAVATSAAVLAQGVLTTMFYAKIQTVAALAATTLVVTTAGVVAARPAFQAGAESRPAPAQVPATTDPAPAETTKRATTPADLEAARAEIKALEAELAEL